MRVKDSDRQMSDQQVFDQIREHKRKLGKQLVILGHHYQHDATFQFADCTGDSLKLSRQAANEGDAKYIVFCGVHFMAEVAAMLAGERQVVILPDIRAGCPMADMADLDDVEQCWQDLTECSSDKIVPVCYINSTAAIKAFCGRHDGAICTSGNCTQVLQWALEHGGKVLFLPDQHLGRNSAYGLGHPLDSMAVYDPSQANGGLTAQQVRDARIILWKGHCYVHMAFTLEHVQRVRRDWPEAKIIVHPECTWEVVQAADLAGSTEYILRTVTDAPAGSSWAIGTEVNMVNRLANKFKGAKTVRCLSPNLPYCANMARTTPRALLKALDGIAEGRIENRITVDPQTREAAMTALKRMLAMRSAAPTGVKES